MDIVFRVEPSLKQMENCSFILLREGKNKQTKQRQENKFRKYLSLGSLKQQFVAYFTKKKKERRINNQHIKPIDMKQNKLYFIPVKG